MNRTPLHLLLIGAAVVALSGCGKLKDKLKLPGTPEPTVSISAAPASIVLGASSTLSWSTTDTSSCTASGDWSGSKATSGSESVTPTAAGTASYELVCTGEGGASGSVALVAVSAAAPTVSLAAAPATVTLGGSSTLSWSSTDASTCTASGDWSGARATSGSESVTPAAAGTASYTLTCSGAGGDGSASAAVTVNPGGSTPVGSVSGNVIDTVSGAPLAGVTIRSGTLSTTSDVNGDFTLASVPASERALVSASLDGYETNQRVVRVVDGQESRLSIQELPVGASAMVTPAAGGEVAIPGSSAKVTFPPGAIDAADPVRVTITDVAPASSEDNMPGDFTAIDAGAERPLETFGAIIVNLRKGDGSPAELRSGSTATLRIPLSTRNSVPAASIPLWYYDTDAGRWVEQGSANLVGSGSTAYYEGEVPHFSTWNADSLYSFITLTGCVSNAGSPAGGVSITSRGIDYSGTSSAVSAADGSFRIRVKPGSRVTLTGQSGRLVTSTAPVNTGTADQTLGSCLQLGGDSLPFSVRLTWGSVPTDLDSHLYLPQGGEIAYYSKGSLTSGPYANLDVDDVSSFGPEVVTVIRPRVGVYRYFVHNFSGTDSISGSPARVELNANGRTYVFTPPSGESGTTRYWSAFDISVSSNCVVTTAPITPVWSTSMPPVPAAPDASAPFCTP